MRKSFGAEVNLNSWAIPLSIYIAKEKNVETLTIVQVLCFQFYWHKHEYDFFTADGFTATSEETLNEVFEALGIEGDSKEIQK